MTSFISKTNESVGQRLKELRESCNFTQNAFAKKIRLATNTYQTRENGYHCVTVRDIYKIKSVYRTLSLEWLLFGNGRMYDEQ